VNTIPQRVEGRPPQGTTPALAAWLASALAAVWTAIRAIGEAAPVQGVHLRSLSVAAGANQIAHTLGRLPRGWIVTRQSDDCALIETDAQLASRTERWMYLTSNIAGTVDVWVF
jgi:hypothetical protein